MSKTTDTDRELTNNELDTVSGGALGFIEPRFPRDSGGGGGALPSMRGINCSTNTAPPDWIEKDHERHQLKV